MAEVPGPSKTAPSYTSSSWSQPPSSVKFLIVKRDNMPEEGICLACGFNGDVQISYILVANDRLLFKAYKAQGLLASQLGHVAHPDNLILLCGQCYQLYSKQQPRLAILPNDLRTFIDYEIADYEMRQQSLNQIPAQHLPRSLPPFSSHLGLCKVFLQGDLDCQVKFRLQAGDNVRFTKASATALILKSGLAMGMPLQMSTVVGFPPDIRDQLSLLFRLWQRGPPQATITPSSAQGQTAIFALSAEQDMPHAKTSLLPPASSTVDNSEQNEPSTKKRGTDKAPMQVEQDETSPNSPPIPLSPVPPTIPNDSNFMFGPSMTAQAIIHTFYTDESIASNKRK